MTFTTKYPNEPAFYYALDREFKKPVVILDPTEIPEPEDYVWGPKVCDCLPANESMLVDVSDWRYKYI